MGEEKALNVGPSGIQVVYERFGDPDAPPAQLIIEGMGHNLPRQLWPEIATHIADLVHHTETLTAGHAH